MLFGFLNGCVPNGGFRFRAFLVVAADGALLVQSRLYSFTAPARKLILRFSEGSLAFLNLGFNFPLELLETPTQNAFQSWQLLKLLRVKLNFTQKRVNHDLALQKQTRAVRVEQIQSLDEKLLKYFAGFKLDRRTTARRAMV